MVPNENACNVFSSLSELIEDITDYYASCRKKKDHLSNMAVDFPTTP